MKAGQGVERARGRWWAASITAVSLTASAAAASAAESPAADVTVGRVTVEVVSLESQVLADAVALASSLTGAAEYTTSSVVTASLPATVRSLFEALLPAGLVRDPVPVDVPPDLPPDSVAPGGSSGYVSGLAARVRADQWHRAGFDGTGVTIGVIDYLDVPLYWNPVEHGPQPGADDVRCWVAGANCRTTFFDGVDAGSERHGMAVVETLREIAPGARLLFGQARTLQDYRDLIDWFASRGVSIITRSLGSRYDDPGDGRGNFNELAEHAVSRGILWVNSVGNNADGNYVRQPVQLLSQGYVSFGGSRYLPFAGEVSLGGVRWVHDWDAPLLTRTDYDVTLLRAPAGRPEQGTSVAVSTAKQTLGSPPLESISGTFTPVAGEQFYLTVRRVIGDVTGDVIEVLDYGDGFMSGFQSAYSAATPIVTSRSTGVISVGAVDPPEGTSIAPYSSQGPSNDGRVIPSVSAPSGYHTTVYGGFGGTSAAAPVVSGIAAVLQSAGRTRDPAKLGDEIRTNVIDRGPAGPDNAFGAGEVRLPALETPSSPPASPGPAPVPAQPPDAVQAAQFVPTPPTRLLDTRAATSPVGPASILGEFSAGEVRALGVAGVGAVPSGAAAVALNVTVVAPGGAGYVQLLPSDAGAPGDFSNLNVDAAGQVRANLAIVPVGSDGRIRIHHQAGGHVVLDMVGYYVDVDGPVSAGRLEQISPVRSLDTRTGPDSTPLVSGSPRAVSLPMSIDAARSSAVIVNVTATNVTAPGFVQVVPTGRDDLLGTTSTINLAPGETVANTAIVPVTPGASSIQVVAGFGSEPPPGAAADVVVDVVGYITSSNAPAATNGRYVPVTPRRAYDSRDHTAAGLPDAAPVLVDATAATEVPGTATGVVWNVAVVAGDRAGFARAWADGAGPPSTSIVNWSAGETRAAAVVSAASAGRSRFVVDDGSVDRPDPVAHLVVDVFGYFT